MLLCIMTYRFHVGFVCPKDIVPEVLLLVQMQLYKPKLCCYVLFRGKRLSTDNSFKTGSLQSSSFLIVHELLYLT